MMFARFIHEYVQPPREMQRLIDAQSSLFARAGIIRL